MRITAIVILIFVAVGVTLLLVKWNRVQHPASLSEIDTLASKWKDWVEVSNSELKPMFHGFILGKAEGWEGLLFVGVLIENNIPTSLAEAIKKSGHTYASDGKILVRCLSAHDQDFIMSGLEDVDTISMLQPLIKEPEKIESRIVLSSAYLDHMDNPEGIKQFDTIWDNSIEKKTKRTTASQ
jgi:hypothetical protein